MTVDSLEEKLVLALRQRVDHEEISLPSVEVLKTISTEFEAAPEPQRFFAARPVLAFAACLMVISAAGWAVFGSSLQRLDDADGDASGGAVLVESGPADAPDEQAEDEQVENDLATSPAPTTIDDMADAGGGIFVHVDIVGDVRSLLAAAAAAAADGLQLGGEGFRDSQIQVEIRRANCGTSDYAIYEMPSSECDPPTARPGMSTHEQGLAIDFTCDGELINDVSNPCWGWLSANAADYGLFALAGEPWHWSTTGR